MTLVNHLNLAYVAVKTSQIDEMVDFYHNILNLDEISYENDMVFLGDKNNRHLVLVLEYDAAHKANSKNSGLDKIHFQVNNIELFQQLSSLPSSLQITSEKLILFDPDGHQLEISLQNKNFDIQSQQQIILKQIDLICANIDAEEKLLNCLDKSITQTLRLYEDETVEQYNGLDYIAFNIDNRDTLNQLKQKFEKYRQDFYYNLGKEIILVESELPFSYWLEVNAHEV